MSYLIGKSFLNSVFQQDPKQDWIKINNVVLGNSPTYGHTYGTNHDVGALLDSLINDPKIVVVLYNWSDGRYYTKTAFNLNVSSDFKTDNIYTAFIVKDRIKNSWVTPELLPAPSSSVPSTSTVPSTTVPEWSSNAKYSVGETITYNGNMYICLQAHSSQPDWTPTAAVSLWEKCTSKTTTTTPPDNSTTTTTTPPDNSTTTTTTPPDNSTTTTTPPDNSTTNSKKPLNDLLSNKYPLGTYFQSWSMGWTSDSSNNELTNVSPQVNIIYLAFATPICTYTSGSNNWNGTGLSFSSDFNVIRDSITILKSKGFIVMLSAGGSTFPWDGFTQQNADSLSALVKDLGVHGIDIDWEPVQNNLSEPDQFGPIINMLSVSNPTMYLSAACFSVGAYGQGNFVNSLPPSNNTQLNIRGLQSNGSQLDWINIMSYDAGDSYNPQEAFKAYQSYLSCPILLGYENDPQAWGSHKTTLDEVKTNTTFVKNSSNDNVKHGVFTWSYQKQGVPPTSDIHSVASSVFNS